MMGNRGGHFTRRLVAGVVCALLATLGSGGAEAQTCGLTGDVAFAVQSQTPTLTVLRKQLRRYPRHGVADGAVDIIYRNEAAVTYNFNLSAVTLPGTVLSTKVVLSGVLDDHYGVPGGDYRSTVTANGTQIQLGTFGNSFGWQHGAPFGATPFNNWTQTTLAAPNPTTSNYPVTLRHFGIGGGCGSDWVAIDYVELHLETCPTGGPVSHWRFDTAASGQTPDSADGNPGTLVGGPTLVPSPMGNAMSFNANPNQFVDFGVKPNLNPPGAFSISVWVKFRNTTFDGWGSAGYIVSNGRDCCGWANGGYGLHLAGPTAGGQPHSPRAYFYPAGAPSSANPIDVRGTSMAPEQWHQIVVIFNGTSLKLYQDGCLTGTTTFTPKTLLPGTTRLVAGAHVPGLTCCNFPFNGEIDELKIYDRALAPCEILAPPAPTLQCPPDREVTIPCGASGYNGDIGAATVTGSCACPASSYTVTRSPAGPYPPGTTTVTWTATSNSCPTLTCQQLVTVHESGTPVQIECGPDVDTTTDPGQCSSSVTPEPPTVSGGCGQVTLTGSRSDGQGLGDPYPKGTTTITWTATDSQGSASCQQTVTVVDNQPPAIASVTASPGALWPPNHKMVTVTVSTSSADNCGETASCQIVSVTSNEPDNGLGDGDTANDIQNISANTVDLRAERSGKGSGRVYTITVACTDSSGNTSTGQVTVTVPKSQGK